MGQIYPLSGQIGANYSHNGACLTTEEANLALYEADYSSQWANWGFSWTNIHSSEMHNTPDEQIRANQHINEANSGAYTPLLYLFYSPTVYFTALKVNITLIE